MKKLSFYLQLALLSLAVVVPLTLLVLNSTAGIDGNEEAVYSAALPALGLGGSAFLIEETTSPYAGSSLRNGSLDMHGNTPAISRSTRNNFLARNRKPSTLSPDMKLDFQYYLISKAELDDIYINTPPSEDGISGGPMEEMRRRYPGTGGLTQISRVGFNRTRTEALVYIYHACGSLCGYTYLVRLEKHNGTWQVMDKWLLGIS
jgi:hypothetical protein